MEGKKKEGKKWGVLEEKDKRKEEMEKVNS